MVNLNGIEVENRFFISSGAAAYGDKYLWARPLIDPTIFGGVVTRTLTLEKRQGHFIEPLKPKEILEQIFWGIQILRERPRVLRKIPGGWINAFGWWNIGIDRYIDEVYPETKRVPKIVSIGGFLKEEYLEMIRRLNGLDILAIELNVSCPNVEIAWEGNVFLFETLMKACRKESQRPLIVKLSAEGDYLTRARIAEDAGINAIHAINTVKGLILNPKTGEPLLKAKYGGISGERIKLIALRVVSEIKQVVSLPVIAGGGIYNWNDCREFFAVGADAVSFGSVHFFQPWKPTWIIRRHQREAEKLVQEI